MTEPPHALTVAEAAEVLGVSERTVWRYLKAGRLAGETVGPPGAQRTLIRAEAVDHLRAGEPSAAATAALRLGVTRLAGELAALRTERDALRVRVDELERALAARPSRAEPVARRARALAQQTTGLIASLRAHRGPTTRRNAQ
jgi:excisionase family DNA binding protein